MLRQSSGRSTTPLEFDEAHRRACWMEIAPGISASFLGLPDLLRLKRQAGRAQDMLDVDKLTALSAEE